jgi:hypothetical protein
MRPSSSHVAVVSTLLPRAVLIVVIGILAAGCSASHDPDPEDPRPVCPEGDDFVQGNACIEQNDCEPSACGRLAGVCVEYAWICGSCDYCFFSQREHVEDTYLPCNPATGLCEE